MERPVEVAVFDRGELQSLRTLSPARERWAGLLAAATASALVLGGMVTAAGVLAGLKFVVHAPTFFISWLAVAGVVGVVSARWVRARLSSYRLGADIEADAFAMADVELIRRAGDDYEIGLVAGMSGAFEHQHSSQPLEAYIRTGPVHLPLPPQGRVRIELGTCTFIVSRPAAAPVRPFPLREWLAWIAAGPIRRLVRAAVLGTPVALLGTLVSSVPAAYAMTDVDERFVIPAGATALETERLIRAKAQFQTPSLHQCFDPLPLACQRPGYVGVGLTLSKDGEIVSHWIARSSYGDDCPVTDCVENVVSTWSFQPMRERMRVVIPIQVKRTRKPIWVHDNVLYVTPEVGDAGAPSNCLDGEPLFGLKF